MAEETRLQELKAAGFQVSEVGDLSSIAYALTGGGTEDVLNSTSSRYGEWIFRGLADAEWDLESSLVRLAKVKKWSFKQFAAVERSVIDSHAAFLRATGTQKLKPAMGRWEYVARARHYGLSCRMADWTKSLWTALHFATVEKPDRPALIWCIGFAAGNDVENGAHKLHRISFTENVAERLKELETAARKRREPSGRDEMLFFEVEPESCGRMLNQEGILAMRLYSNDQGSFDVSTEDLLKPQPRHSNGNWLRLLYLETEAKRSIRRLLDLQGYHERYFFPGEEGQCRYLNRFAEQHHDQLFESDNR